MSPKIIKSLSTVTACRIRCDSQSAKLVQSVNENSFLQVRFDNGVEAVALVKVSHPSARININVHDVS